MTADSVMPLRPPAVKPHPTQGKKGSTMPMLASQMAFTPGMPFIVTLDVSDAPDDTQVQSSVFGTDGGEEGPIAWDSPNGFASSTYTLDGISLLTIVIIPNASGRNSGSLTITFTNPNVNPVTISVVPTPLNCCSFCNG
jgi:hypothetical protein